MLKKLLKLFLATYFWLLSLFTKSDLPVDTVQPTDNPVKKADKIVGMRRAHRYWKKGLIKAPAYCRTEAEQIKWVYRSKPSAFWNS